jgi:hypothetical protein
VVVCLRKATKPLWASAFLAEEWFYLTTMNRKAPTALTHSVRHWEDTRPGVMSPTSWCGVSPPTWRQNAYFQLIICKVYETTTFGKVGSSSRVIHQSAHWRIYVVLWAENLSCSVTLSELYDLSVPQSPHLYTNVTVQLLAFIFNSWTVAGAK